MDKLTTRALQAQVEAANVDRENSNKIKQEEGALSVARVKAQARNVRFVLIQLTWLHLRVSCDLHTWSYLDASRRRSVQRRRRCPRTSRTSTHRSRGTSPSHEDGR